jgi:nucleotide-binding universal stress UspA family protein
MAYRSILVHVDNSRAAETRVAVAAALAARFKCDLTGAFLRSEPHLSHLIADTIAPAAGEEFERVLSEMAKVTANAVVAAREVFDEAARAANVPSCWLSLDGDSQTEFISVARRQDLTVLPPEMKTHFGERSITAAQVGMASGGPVLVLKHGGYPLDFGKKILVAWNDSRESARALRDAWPFLSKADQVNFLVASRDASDKLDELLLRHLKEHCCRFGRLVVDRSDTDSVADTIRLHVAQTGADMVVMGLYGHSRLQEMVLGGVSRDLLHDPPMPLLVSH